MDRRTRLVHPCWWIGVERRDDAHLRRNTLPQMRRDGYDFATPQQMRAACGEARAKGLEVLPHPGCINRGRDGRCRGHAMPRSETR